MDEALERLGPAPELAALRAEPAALARLVLSRLAGEPVSPARTAEILRLSDHGTHQLDVSGGVRAVVEYGRVRFARGAEAEAPEPVALHVPGSVALRRLGGRGASRRAG